MSRMYLAPPDSHTPDKSGWPSADLGAGAERLGLPSGPFGIPPAGTFTHWPYTGAQISTTMATDSGGTAARISVRMTNAGKPKSFIGALLLAASLAVTEKDIRADRTETIVPVIMDSSSRF